MRGSPNSEESEEMKITIDGNVIEAEGQKTILDLAREKGIFIPSLCDHAELTPFTGCRLCLVEIEGRRGYSPACATAVGDGMVVRTTTPELNELRREILELILSEHPNACLVCTEKENCDEYKSTIRKVSEVTGCVLCSNNRRCELQDVVDALKIEKVRFPSVYRDFEIKREDPFFDRNYNLCILCGRCVRICHDLRGASAITFVYRGSDEVIGTALDKPLLESGCQFCGACVDVCPTGALEERALKYEPLHDAQKKTICPLCSIGCELDVFFQGGRLLGASPSAEGAPNRGQACVKGRFLIKDIVTSGKRILKPLIRKKNELEEATWEEALDFIEDKLKKFKGDEIAVIESGQATCEDGYVLRKFAGEVLKTDNINTKALFSPLREVEKTALAGASTILTNFKITDIAEAETIFLTGTDLVTSHPIIWLQVHKAIKRGAKLVVASPTEYRLNRHVQSWLRVIPGTESFLFGYLAKLVAQKQITRNVPLPSGFDGFEKQLEKLSLTNAYEQTGAEKELMEETADILARGDPSVFLLGAGTNPESVPALWNLALLTQAKLIPLDLENNQRGLSALGRGAPDTEKDSGDILHSLAQGAVKALYLVGSLVLPKKTKLEFFVVQSPFLDSNAEKADAVLPAVTFAETEGILVNVEGRFQKREKVMEPPGECKPDWWIVSELSKRRGARGFDFQKTSDIGKEIRAANPLFAKATDAVLAKNKELFLEESDKEEMKLAPMTFASPPASNRKFPLSMVVDISLDYYRNIDLTQEIKGFGLIRNSRCVFMNSEDAQKFGFADGEPVKVCASGGEIDGTLKISDSMPPGLVSSQLVFSGDSRYSVISLMGPFLKGENSKIVIPVRIERG